MCIYTYMADSSSRQKPTQVRVAWHCTCFNVRRASRAVTQFYDDIMAPSGIKATQFTMLGAVALMGPASVTRLAAHLALDRTTLTRNLKVLADQGLVSIAAGDDKRERVVSLTEQGRAALQAYGIAPPPKGQGRDTLHDPGPAECPHCGGTDTVQVSEFGSTACKALYKCRDCLEPFDYFKCL